MLALTRGNRLADLGKFHGIFGVRSHEGRFLADVVKPWFVGIGSSCVTADLSGQTGCIDKT